LNNNKNNQQNENKVRDLLPFWARELLAMQDEAMNERKVHEPSAK
jgi:hypothetical protein